MHHVLAGNRDSAVYVVATAVYTFDDLADCGHFKIISNYFYIIMIILLLFT